MGSGVYSTVIPISVASVVLFFQIRQLIHLLQISQDAMRFHLIEDAEGESYVHNHIITDHRFRHVRETDFLHNAPEIHLAPAQERILIRDLCDLSWNC